MTYKMPEAAVRASMQSPDVGSNSPAFFSGRFRQSARLIFRIDDAKSIRRALLLGQLSRGPRCSNKAAPQVRGRRRLPLWGELVATLRRYVAHVTRWCRPAFQKRNVGSPLLKKARLTGGAYLVDCTALWRVAARANAPLLFRRNGHWADIQRH
jgi:hypothetical protein